MVRDGEASTNPKPTLALDPSNKEMIRGRQPSVVNIAHSDRQGKTVAKTRHLSLHDLHKTILT